MKFIENSKKICSIIDLFVFLLFVTDRQFSRNPFKLRWFRNCLFFGYVFVMVKIQHDSCFNLTFLIIIHREQVSTNAQTHFMYTVTYAVLENHLNKCICVLFSQSEQLQFFLNFWFYFKRSQKLSNFMLMFVFYSFGYQLIMSDQFGFYVLFSGTSHQTFIVLEFKTQCFPLSFSIRTIFFCVFVN